MSIKIGNHNKITNTIISDKSSISENSFERNLIQKHPIITGIFIAVVAGFILMFPFWNKIKLFIVNFFTRI